MRVLSLQICHSTVITVTYLPPSQGHQLISIVDWVVSLSLSLSSLNFRSTPVSSLCGPICAIWIVIVCCLGLCSLGFIFLGLISLFLGLIHLGVIYLSLGLFFSFKPKNIQRIWPMSTRTKTDQIQRWFLVVNGGSVPNQVQNQSKTTHEQPYMTLSFLHSQITVLTRYYVAIIIVSCGGGGGRFT